MTKRKKQIAWETYCEPISPAIVEEVGTRLGITFPGNYVKCASQFHCGTPNFECFDIPGRPECVFANLLGFGDEDNLYENYLAVKDRIPPRVIPFAVDPFGNGICFDFRQNQLEPSIVFWNHEVNARDKRSIVPISKSFDEFLKVLYLPEE